MNPYTNEPLYCPSITTIGYEPFSDSWVYLWAGKPCLLQCLLHKTNCHPLDNLHIVHYYPLSRFCSQVDYKCSLVFVKLGRAAEGSWGNHSC